MTIQDESHHVTSNGEFVPLVLKHGVLLAVVCLSLVGLATSVRYALTVAVMPIGNPKLPPLADRIRLTDAFGGGPEWPQRLRGRFEAGSDITAMVASLRADGFDVDATHREAEYTFGESFCRMDFSVRWTADPAGKLQDVTGHVIRTCV